MRHVQVLLTKQFGAADRANQKNQTGFPLFDKVTPIGLMISGRIGALGGYFMPHEVSGLNSSACVRYECFPTSVGLTG
jgi:hypothetical protein